MTEVKRLAVIGAGQMVSALSVPFLSFLLAIAGKGLSLWLALDGMTLRPLFSSIL